MVIGIALVMAGEVIWRDIFTERTRLARTAGRLLPGKRAIKNRVSDGQLAMRQ